ncbi:acyl-CoA oxidase [Polychaeton citri CBS 116435]|uniref:Acyl-coenzyme A oxidase n=1 Tax=Polychaeton citri CBS 116435 TaxID=1314669 RepID=A0A9P4UNH1_9PEZI|nr:acyl-CoA oxidase [Polychaeton citri CBS 116435]
MFVNTVREQGNEAQRIFWLPKIESWEIIGCYAQTELGHGSNVRGIETEAMWQHSTREFVLHSPTLTSSKWWNGSMGRTANHAIVVAQLKIPRPNKTGQYVSHGPHAFIVQIRDMDTHKPLPGIIVGDIGPKYGYASMDNGYMLFDRYHIPHSALLANHSRIDPNTGIYTAPANPAVVYGSLTFIRASIIMHARLVLARAVTVAVRYTSIRRQFPDRDNNDSKSSELAVLDYTTVQIRILPMLATAFALHYTGEAMHTLYRKARAEISRGDSSRLAVVHSQSSGLKSLCTELAANGIETCRRAMGGHGFGGGSGLIQLNADYLSKPTVEGDNWMITQQTSRYLIKRMAAAERGGADAHDELERSYRKFLAEQDSYRLDDLDVLHNDDHIVLAFTRRSQDQTYRAHVERNVEKRRWNDMLVQLRQVSHAESQSIMITNFHRAIKDVGNGLSSTLKHHLRTLFRLFAFHTMDIEARDFAKANAVSWTVLEQLPYYVQQTMSLIRPHAVSLVDAFKIPDYLLDSALGRYDGKVYEDLYNRAHRLNPLNDLTFNPNYKDDEILKGEDDSVLAAIAAKL